MVNNILTYLRYFVNMNFSFLFKYFNNVLYQAPLTVSVPMLLYALVGFASSYRENVYIRRRMPQRRGKWNKRKMENNDS